MSQSSATGATKAAIASQAATLPLLDRQDFDDATRVDADLDIVTP